MAKKSSSKLNKSTSTSAKMKASGAKYSTTNSKGQQSFYSSSRDSDGGKAIGTSTVADKNVTPVITPDSLKNVPTPNIPTPSQPTFNDPFNITNTPALQGLGFNVENNQYKFDPKLSESENAAAESNQKQQQNMQSYINNMLGVKPQSLEKDYLAMEKKAGIQKLQNEVGNYTSQLNNIIATRDQNLLRTEGQGRGIPEVIIGGQQAQIQKEAAIQALPVQAALDAAQGNLAMAQQRVDKLFSIHREDVQNDFNFKKGLIDSVYQFANQSEQNRLNAKLTSIKEQTAEKNQNISMMQQWAQIAMQNGQNNLIQAFTSLNPKSPTFVQELGRLQAQVIDQESALNREAKRASINTEYLQQQNIKDQIRSRQESDTLAAFKTAENPNGTINGKPQNATQSQIQGYADRLAEADRIFDTIEEQFTSKVAFGDKLPNLLQSSERQQFEQAKRNFINSVLRRESGATITDTEFDNAKKQYFAAPGDSPETLEQKRNNRNTVINNLYREANVPRPVVPGDVITDDSTGKQYRVGDDGVTLIEI